MSASVSAPANLLSLLQDERDALILFVDLLEQEQQILLGTDVEALSNLVEKKNQTIADIMKRSKTRKLELANLSTEAQIEEALQRQDPTALPLWRETRTLASRAQHLNETNGKLIQTRLRANQQTLTVLHNASESTLLYGSNGQPNLPSSGRTLAKG